MASRSSLDALLGILFDDGDELELRSGIDFIGFQISADEARDVYEIVAPRENVNETGSNTWNVDPNADVDEADQDGTPVAPFTTLAAAVAAAASGDSIMLRPGDAGDAEWETKDLNLYGIGGSVGALTATGSAVSLHGLTCTDDIEVDGGATANVTFSRCSFDGGITVTGTSAWDDYSARLFQLDSGVIEEDSLPLSTEGRAWYGDGADGDLSSGCGAVTLTRDMYYDNFGPFTTGDAISPNGFRIFVANICDLRGAPAGLLDVTSNASRTGIDASGQTAGTGLSAPTASGSLPQQPGNSVNGGKGGAINSAGTNGVVSNQAGLASLGGNGGSGAVGGAGSGGKAAGTAGTFTAPTVDHRFPRDLYLRVQGPTLRSAAPGGGGSGGGGSPTTSVGGGGGASALPGSPGLLHARVIVRDATTNATAIDVTGVAGGDGGAGASGGGEGGGGGGGGSGAPGSALHVCADWYLGAPRVCIACSGGAGGIGGAGGTSATGGTGGPGGGSATVMKGNRITNTWTYTASVAGSAGSGPSGATGGAGGGGGSSNVSL